ncbi:DUF4344 domain-containing metallopeptidase [Mycolicibacterium phlei]|uniref:DUF4344 domain-containing metallopeptidase n=1 Tax=Mycolicibacterium phlei TaxID=1771 RepID=UPI00025ADE0C|nr:DUF4344 domain-containing metallopeptidase [Mycolicibacterium phlei]EID14711.1 hypothetical protein MPHLEI_10264 [Mycolicibacterium phlei RIVM601174]MBF4191445.1 hypothetical protein [Mycolicibacterium phlei]
MRHVVSGVVLALAVAGCGAGDREPEASSETSAEAAEASEERTKAEDADTGQMIVTYEEATSPEAVRGRELLESNTHLEDLAADINDSLILPYDVELIGTECGEANAFWNSEDNTVTICYEDADAALQTFTDDGADDPVVAALNAETATFYHEVGHMVISLYDLPVTGREEDVADQLAAYVLLAPGDDGKPDPDSVQAVKDFARTFQALGDQRDEIDVEELADPHSLDETRVYNLECWIYGADPEDNADLVGDDGLPEDRADGCEHEYAQLQNAWTTLLSPHIKE